MAAIFQERAGVPPRRKMAMYGKSAKRRIPEFSFAAMAQRSPASEMFEMPEEFTQENVLPTTRPAVVRSTTPTKLKSIARTSPARSPAAQNEDLYNVPDDEETPKKTPAPVLKTKPKPTQKKQAVKTTLSGASSTADIWDVPGDDQAPKTVRQRAATPPRPKPTTQKQATKPTAAKFPSTADIWDVPIDGPAPKTVRQRTISPQKVKPRARKSPAVTPDLSPNKISVCDVPFDNERPPPSAKRSHQTMQKPITSNVLRSVEVLQPAPERSNKKLRLSPVRDSPVKLAPIKKYGLQAPKLLPVTRSLPSRNRSPSQVQMVARPKVQAPARKTEAVRAIRQVTPQPKRFQAAPETPPVARTDVEMLDAIPAPPQNISPRGLKILQNLIDSVENSEEECVVKSAERVGRTQAASSAFNGILSRPAGVMKSRSPKLPPRRRLIDTLVEQKQESEEESTDTSSEITSDSFSDIEQPIEVMKASDSQVTSQPVSRPPLMTSDSQVSQGGPRVTYGRVRSFIGDSNSQFDSQLVSRPALMTSDSQLSQGGSRITYGRVRSFIDDSDILKDLGMELPSQSTCIAGPRRVGAAGLKSLASFNIDEEDNDDAPAISSVHELRLAGVNNRFMDNVQDCLGQIGKPAKTPAAKSARRAGLMDLASRMKDKSFMKQFRDNAIEQRLFLHLDQEIDIVAGFLMVSLLISVLSEGNMPHLVTHLRQHGIAELITRLLGCQSSITAIGKERKTNMSKVAQSLLAEHHGHLTKIPAWEEVQPESLSPRTLTLKCLEIMAKQSGKQGMPSDFISEGIISTLFDVLNSPSDERCWDLPNGKFAIDFYLAMTILGCHCVNPGVFYDKALWTGKYLPIIANTLEVGITKPVEDFGPLQMLILQLTVEIGIHSPESCELQFCEPFAKPSLLSAMARATVSMFEMILPLTEEDPALLLLTDHLIVLLFAMCHLAEWNSTVGEVLQSFQGQDDDPMESMIHIFTANREKISMADSLEETRKNTPFGHLAVLLGQLALSPAIFKRIQRSQQRKTISPLIDSIEDFMNLNKTVDSQQIDEDGLSSRDPLTERLETLVEKLNSLH